MSPPEVAAWQLCGLLEEYVERVLANDPKAGVWLSGGLDSSTLAALVSEQVTKPDTFTVGIPGSDDLEYGRMVAQAVQSNHHELVVTLNEVLSTLPTAIYYLETFEPVCIRTGVMCFIAARYSSDHVATVLCGDGADDLFGGYEYLKRFEPIDLDAELMKLTSKLHATVLRRVDRCSSANGLKACMPFLDNRILEYAFRTSPGYKVWEGTTKWLIREAMAGMLPYQVIRRRKSECWDTATLQSILERHADSQISDHEFHSERRRLKCVDIRSKEELYYYRIFREHFGDLDDLAFIDRSPVETTQRS